MRSIITTLEIKEVPINPNTLVVGGGIAGFRQPWTLPTPVIKFIWSSGSPPLWHMIQSIRHPHLDCSACIMTPKMSDAGSHPNITLFTYSDVEEVSGYIAFQGEDQKEGQVCGSQQVHRMRSMFSRMSGYMKNEFDMNLAERKAIYKPFPQAVPNKR